MKRCLLVCVLITMCMHADDRDQTPILVMQSPAKFIQNDEIAASAQQWVAQYINPLTEAEVKVVSKTLKLGKEFSAIDVKMRSLVQKILVTICSLYQEITNGGNDQFGSQELELEIAEFSKLRTLHAFMFHEWQAWENFISVSENKRIDAALEAVNGAIRNQIEFALAQKEWQKLTARIPVSVHNSIKTLTLLSTLCANSSDNNKTQESSETADAVLLFDVIAQAAETSCRNSFEPIESTSQILIYEALLLEISYAMFDAYLQAMG